MLRKVFPGVVRVYTELSFIEISNNESIFNGGELFLGRSVLIIA